MSVCLREKQLSDLFGQFGKVLHIEVRKSKEEFKFQGYGFVTMLNWANTQHDLKDQLNAQAAVNFTSSQIDHLVCEETLRALFSQTGGEVVDVRIKQYRIDEGARFCSGLAFVHFPLTVDGIYTLKRAMHQLGSICVDQINFDTGISMNLEKILRERPELNVKYIPEGHSSEPSFSSRKQNKTRQFITLPYSLPFTNIKSLEHFVERPAGTASPTPPRYGSPHPDSVSAGLAPQRMPLGQPPVYHQSPPSAPPAAPQVFQPQVNAQVPQLHVNRHYNPLKQ
eukprot:gene32078-39623_t